MRMNKETHRVYTRHKFVHGSNHLNRLIEQAIEECCELAVALSHMKRGRVGCSRVMEEFADVQVCLDFIAETNRFDDRLEIKNRECIVQRLDEQLDNIEANRAHV